MVHPPPWVPSVSLPIRPSIALVVRALLDVRRRNAPAVRVRLRTIQQTRLKVMASMTHSIVASPISRRHVFNNPVLCIHNLIQLPLLPIE